MKNDVLITRSKFAVDKEVGVPSFRRRASVIDDDSADEPRRGLDRTVDPERARALAEEAEAEAAEAEAVAAAARARARALRLRREAEAVTAEAPVTPTTVEAEPEVAEAPAELGPSDAEDISEAADESGEVIQTVDGEAVPEDSDEDSDEGAEPESRRFRLPRPKWKAIAASVVILCTLALLGLSGYFIWHHKQADKLRQQNAEYSAAARQSVVTLMSLDFTKAQEDVQRIIDNSTGQFKSDFQSQAKDFVKVAQDSKVITQVTVNATAVEQMDADTAVVLVSAASRVTNTAGANQEPRTWRLSVNLQRDGGQIKMSKVEFVP
jgi:Mce-associated membrane protein